MPACRSINGLTDEYHPTQMLADVMTMREHTDKPLHADQIRLSRRHALQHGPFADDRRLPDGHGRAHCRAESTLAGRGLSSKIATGTRGEVPAPGSRSPTIPRRR